MKLKNGVILNMPKTVGEMRFGGLREEHMGRVRNTRTVVTREYNIFSKVQEEELQVRIPGRVGAKTFGFRQQVDLVKPRLIAEGRNIGGSAYVDYVIEAEDIVAVGGVK